MVREIGMVGLLFVMTSGGAEDAVFDAEFLCVGMSEAEGAGEIQEGPRATHCLIASKMVRLRSSGPT